MGIVVCRELLSHIIKIHPYLVSSCFDVIPIFLIPQFEEFTSIVCDLEEYMSPQYCLRLFVDILAEC